MRLHATIAVVTDPTASRTEDAFDELALAERSRARLRDLAGTGCPGSLAILQAPVGDVGPAAGLALARAVLHSDKARDLDIRVVAPEGDRWTVSEVDVSLVTPASLTPEERNVVVVCAADAMDAACAEHLLKTVEEPSAPTLFVFVTERNDRLLTTIIGRASVIVALEAATDDARVARLVEDGVDGDLAAELVAVAGPFTNLVRAALTDDSVLADVRAGLTAALPAERTCTAAFDLAEALSRLAAIPVDVTGDKPPAPLVKARTRALARFVLSRWRGHLALEVRDVADAAGYRRIAASMTAIDAAERDVAAYTPLNYVLAGLFAQVAAAG